MKEDFFTPLELDILQETLNIAFGSASAELADMIDIFIALDTPKANVISIDKIEEYIESQTGLKEKYNIVEQHFSGEVAGVALLVFPEGAGHDLLSYFEKGESKYPFPTPLAGLAREALMEIGNILIGACLSKFYDLLKIHINFFPPRIIIARNFKQFFDDESFNSNSNVIAMKTQFKFEDKDLSGHLFIVTNNDSSPVLKDGLKHFWESING